MEGQRERERSEEPLSGRRTNSSQWTENVGSRWVDGTLLNRERLAGLARSDWFGRIYENDVQRRLENQRRSRDAANSRVQQEQQQQLLEQQQQQEEQQQQLASITISEDHISVNSSYSSCSICHDDFRLGEEAYRIQFCSHVYHRPCLFKWLLQQKKCPLCRYEIPTGSLNHELI